MFDNFLRHRLDDHPDHRSALRILVKSGRFENEDPALCPPKLYFLGAESVCDNNVAGSEKNDRSADRRFTRFTRTHPNTFFQGDDEYFPVTNITGTRSLDDCVNSGFDKIIIHGYFEAHLVQ